jgi:hypothetical protein
MFLLKSLFPKVDWSTPQTAIAGIIPGFDVETAATDLMAAALVVKGLNERIDRIERKLDQLMQASGAEYSPAVALLPEVNTDSFMRP